MVDDILQDTLVAMFDRRVNEDGDKPAIHFEVRRGHLEQGSRRRATHRRGLG